MSTTNTTTFDPTYVPDDPAAAALDLLTQMPIVAGCAAGSDGAAVFQDIAGMMQMEGILDGLDWNDARHTISVLGIDLLTEG